MTRPLVDRDEIRVAMVGMVDANGHPYSWSAMFNGYDPAAMEECPYPVIARYLEKQPKANLSIPGARVTHIWADDPDEARHVARCSLIPNVVREPGDVIGAVDAVIIPTDKGHEHVERCRPFIDAGLPVFIDKPLVDNAADLEVFRGWVAAGHPLMSSSSMRYTKEYGPYRLSTHELGTLRYVGMTMCKSWERYGIHALEALYPVIGPGFESVRNSGSPERNVVHMKHSRGADAVIVNTMDMAGGAGLLTLAGTADHVVVKSRDSFFSFKAQLEAFIGYLRSGRRPFPFEETVELMQLLIAGIRSRAEGGREVALTEIGGERDTP